ncbi:MAG: AbrB/MazE/SpoVT family DNA-binding domain-containing protein [Caldilineaceae bacterium]
MEATVRVRKRGVLTLPTDLCEKYGIAEGDTFRIVDVNGVFILSPITPSVSDLAREIEHLRVVAGITTEELLEGLSHQRQRYCEET